VIRQLPNYFSIKKGFFNSNILTKTCVGKMTKHPEWGSASGKICEALTMMFRNGTKPDNIVMSKILLKTKL
jgi:hypothetical protein